MGIEDYDDELASIIEEIVLEGYIEKGSAEYGISLKVADGGYNELSAKQLHLFNTKVAPHIARIRQRNEVAERIRSMPD